VKGIKEIKARDQRPGINLIKGRARETLINYNNIDISLCCCIS